jgi:tripartite-type tricarboxylate transporter receptor subunit TctC
MASNGFHRQGGCNVVRIGNAQVGRRLRCHWNICHRECGGAAVPNKTIKIISPFGAGGTPDALGRVVAQQLGTRLGQNVIIENRPGGGLTIAPKAVASADPDGYTLLQASNALAYTTVLYPNAGYDPFKSFAPVATLAVWSHLLMVPANVPATTVQELIAYANANPGQVNIGFPRGGAPQVLAELFKRHSGAKLNSVPYRQNAQLVADLLAGRIHVFFGTGAGPLALVQQGKLKALAYTGVTRHAALPLVPTVIEAGLPELAFNPSDWTGILAPAGTPTDVIDKLNAAINGSLTSPEIQTRIAQQGADVRISSAQKFAAFLAAEAKKWPPRVNAAGMTPE